VSSISTDSWLPPQHSSVSAASSLRIWPIRFVGATLCAFSLTGTDSCHLGCGRYSLRFQSRRTVISVVALPVGSPNPTGHPRSGSAKRSRPERRFAAHSPVSTDTATYSSVRTSISLASHPSTVVGPRRGPDDHRPGGRGECLSAASDSNPKSRFPADRERIVAQPEHVERPSRALDTEVTSIASRWLC